VINVSHLAEQIVARFGDGSRVGMRSTGRTKPSRSRPRAASRWRARCWAEPFPAGECGHLVRLRISRSCADSTWAGASRTWCSSESGPASRGDFHLENGIVGNAPSPRYTYAALR
jgi:hypothetical protein